MSDKEHNMGESIPGNRILVIDTDENIRQLIMRGLDRVGAEVIAAANSYEGLEKYHLYRPDLAIIDGTLPESGGWEACTRIRENSLVPVLMLISNRDKDVERGLACGADEFIRKPFSTRMLLARINSLIQRVGLSHSGRSSIIYDDGYLTVDLETDRILIKGEPVKLTPTENKLLTYLIFHAGRVRTFSQILQNVWGWANMDKDAYIHVYISNLRRKIEPDPKNPRYLLTEYRIGYRFEKQPPG